MTSILESKEGGQGSRTKTEPSNGGEEVGRKRKSARTMAIGKEDEKRRSASLTAHAFCMHNIGLAIISGRNGVPDCAGKFVGNQEETMTRRGRRRQRKYRRGGAKVVN